MAKHYKICTSRKINKISASECPCKAICNCHKSESNEALEN